MKIATAAGMVIFLWCAPPAEGFSWTLVNAKIRHDFPNVNRITTSELAAWLGDRKRTAPLLLDVRTLPEFEVSHLANAQHVEPDSAVSAIRRPKDQPIVTYCSVGYRSGQFAQKLQAAGFTKVMNLDGSIFRWANEGRPILRGDRAAEKVHPYNRTWGLLLEKKYRAAVTPIDPKS